MIFIRVFQTLLLISIVFVFLPFSSQAKVLPKSLFEKALQESNDGDFVQAEKDWSFYLKENPNDSAALSDSFNEIPKPRLSNIGYVCCLPTALSSSKF